MRDLVEKPPREEAPSDLAIIGRYILTPDIFPALAATKSDRTGEIQLTNGLRELLKTRPIYACEIKGVRHDTGNKLGFLKAVVYFALRRPDLAEQVRGVSRRRSICTRRSAQTASRSARSLALGVRLTTRRRGWRVGLTSTSSRSVDLLDVRFGLRLGLLGFVVVSLFAGLSRLLACLGLVRLVGLAAPRPNPSSRSR